MLYVYAAGSYFNDIKIRKYVSQEPSIVTTTTTSTTTIPPVMVTRELPDNVNAGAQLTVTLIMDINELDIPDAVGIAETPPDGWGVISTSPTGSTTSTPGSIEWIFWDMGHPIQDTNITYTLNVSENSTGTHTFNGSIDYGEDIIPSISGDSEITVLCPLNGDYPPCGDVTLGEVIDFIVLWKNEEVSLDDVIDLITEWVSG